jgi:molecular chaperone GrpE
VNEQHPEERVVVTDRRRIDPETGEVRVHTRPSPGAGAQPAPAAPAAPADDTAAQLAERTADLQRVTAEYANYRKRVDRDRQRVVDTATGAVLAALLPVLDDIDRARQHGDLTGAFKAVADQLEATLEKLGLQPYGVEGDRFDPTRHEAVAHQTSPDVTEPTCVAVLRRGYRMGERLLRVPLVAVAEPAPAGTEAGFEVGGAAAAGTAETGTAGTAETGTTAESTGRAGPAEPAAEWFGDGDPGDDTGPTG